MHFRRVGNGVVHFLGIINGGNFSGRAGAQKLGRRRRLVEFQPKNKRPNLELVAVLQTAFSFEASPIDQGAIAASQVTQVNAVVRNPKQAVLPADPIAIGPDMAFFAPAKDKFTARKKECFSLGSSMNHK
jgi:hypothetical protein